MTTDDLDTLLAKFDTDKESPLRDANPALWAVLHGAELIACVPFEEFQKDAGLQYWVWVYARHVARSAVALFDPDGSRKATADDTDDTFTADGRIRCDHPGCRDGSTHDVTDRPTTEWTRVRYYCESHAPAGSGLIEDDTGDTNEGTR